MNKKNMVLLSIFVVLSNCAFGNPNGYGPPGMLYSSYKIGLSGSDPKALKGKRGTACVTKYGIFATEFEGGGGVVNAARNGGIVKIYSVDFEVTSFILGLYSEACTVITGE